jgi:hypothetical protein
MRLQQLKLTCHPTDNDGIHRADGGCSFFEPGDSAPVECFVIW